MGVGLSNSNSGMQFLIDFLNY